LELRCYAHLCADEAAAWAGDRPDRATRAFEAARELLAAHLGQWGEVAMEALRRRAVGSPYAAVADAVTTFLASEAARLRPAPDHPDLPPIEVDDPPETLGPARLARWLLSPARSGAFLDTDDLADAALALGIPWRASDPRSRFRQVVEDAVDAGDVAVLAERLRGPIQRWRAFHSEREASRDGDRRIWRAWRLRTEDTLALLDRVISRSANPQDAAPVVVTVTAADPETRRTLLLETVDRLRALDTRLTVALDLDPALVRLAGEVRSVGAADVMLTGPSIRATVDDEAAADPATCGDATIVVRLEQSTSSAVSVEAGDERPLAAAARRLLADLTTGDERLPTSR
jgi:hypothetical protein